MKTFLRFLVFLFFSPFSVSFAQMLSISPQVSVEEREGGCTFEVSLSASSTSVITVRYLTQDLTAKSTEDYVFISDTIRFHPGTTRRTISVVVINDRIEEPDETFRVVLRNPVGATLRDSVGIATIINDDYAPVAVDDEFRVLEDTPEDLPILLNDSDKDDGIPRVEVLLLGQPKNGTLTPLTGPSGYVLNYLPNTNFFGRDSFRYLLFDGNNYSDTATVSLNVIPVNDPPYWKSPISDASSCISGSVVIDPKPLIADVDDSVKNPLFTFRARVLSQIGDVKASDLEIVYNPGPKTLIFFCKVNQSCTFSVAAEAVDPFLATAADTFTITFYPLPVPAIKSSLVCLGSPTELEAVPVIPQGEVLGWWWDFDGDSIADVTKGKTRYTFPKDGYNYIWVSATSNRGCSVYQRDSVLVLPRFKPTIIQNPSNKLQLTASPAVSYQWYEDGAAIPESEGGKQRTIIARRKVGYHFSAVNDKGCTALSDTVFIDATALDEMLLHTSRLLPNPARNTVELQLENQLFGVITVRIIDQTGKTITTIQGFKNVDFWGLSIPIDGFAAGVYFVEIVAQQIKATQKLIVMP